MSITDELREYTEEQIKWVDMTKVHYRNLFAIADRIDAEHAETQRRWMAELDAAREQSFNAGFDDGFASADDWLAQHEDAMREHGWVRLPKDANGEPIHVGDTVEWLDEPHHPITVVGVGKNTLFYIDDDANAQWTMAITKRHHAKTVEDVLRDMLDAWGELPSNATNEAIIAEYATKLRLAESEES